MFIISPAGASVTNKALIKKKIQNKQKSIRNFTNSAWKRTGRIRKVTNRGWKVIGDIRNITKACSMPESCILKFPNRTCKLTGGFRKITKGTRKPPRGIRKVTNTIQKDIGDTLILTNRKLKILRVYVDFWGKKEEVYYIKFFYNYLQQLGRVVVKNKSR